MATQDRRNTGSRTTEEELEETPPPAAEPSEAASAQTEGVDDLLDEIVDRYGEPPKGVLNLIDIALLRAKARAVGIKDIRQKGGDVLFTLANLNFDAVGAICSDADYKQRVTFLPNAKEPTLRLKLSTGVDSLKQSKIFIDRYSSFCNS